MPNLPDAEKARLKELAKEAVMSCQLAQGARLLAFHAAASPSTVKALLEELAAFTALEKHLPEGFAIGDDATAELAIKLVAAEAERDRMDVKLKHAVLCQNRICVICGDILKEMAKQAEAALTEKGVTKG